MIDTKGIVLRGSLLRTLLLFANVAAGLYLMPFIIHSIGDRWYGMWVLVATIMGYYGYFDFGLSMSAQRFIAAAIGRQDTKEINQLVTTVLSVFLLLGILVLTVTFLIILTTPWFIADQVEVRTFRIVLSVLGLNVALTFSAAAVNGLITGHLRYDIASFIDFTKLMVRTALIIYFIGTGYSIIALAIITTIADSGGNIVKVLVAHRIFRDLRVGRRFYHGERLPELLAYGGKTFVSQIAEMMRFQLDHLVIATFISLSAVTLFNIAGQLVYHFRRLLEALMSVLIPVYARFQAAENHEAIVHTYYLTSRLAVLVSILVGGAAIVFGERFLLLWMGQEYVGAYLLLVILILPTILLMAQQPGITLIYGLGEVGMFAKVSLIEAIGNLALSIILVGPYGLLGVALGTAIPLTLFSLFVLVFSNRLIGANWRTYVRRVAPVMVVAFSLQVLAWFVVGQVEIASYSDIVLLFLTVYPTIGVVLFLIAFSSQERRAMIEATRHALGLS